MKPLVVDELGYLPLSPTGAELPFEGHSQRYERGSTIVISNLPFENWIVFRRAVSTMIGVGGPIIPFSEINGLKGSRRRR